MSAAPAPDRNPVEEAVVNLYAEGCTNVEIVERLLDQLLADREFTFSALVGRVGEITRSARVTAVQRGPRLRVVVGSQSGEARTLLGAGGPDFWTLRWAVSGKTTETMDAEGAAAEVEHRKGIERGLRTQRRWIERMDALRSEHGCKTWGELRDKGIELPPAPRSLR
jgi:hypothetical protein